MRLEYKYLISNSILPHIRQDLLPYVTYDKHLQNGNQDYTVRSIYFDNRKLDYFYDKIEGIKTRKKLRIRGYNFKQGKNLIFLEIKKKCENHVYKNRSPLLFENINQLFETGDVERFVSDQYRNDKSVDDGKRFFYHFINKSLRPIVLVVYEREAFSCKFDDRLRITFDMNLRYHPFPSMEDLYSDEHLYKVLINRTILEIKFNRNKPTWLQNIINKYQLSRQSLSKYVICLDDYSKRHPLNDNIRSAFTNHSLLGNNSLESVPAAPSPGGMEQ